MKEIFTSVEFWKLVVPVLAGIIAWLANENQKRKWEEYQRKESSYKELIISLRGFYVNTKNPKELKTDFIDQLNLCWLYCPDEVIRKGYEFLDTVNTKKIYSDEGKENAMGGFVIAIRKDLLSRKLVKITDLEAKSFQHLKAT